MLLRVEKASRQIDHPCSEGFTLLETMTVILIIAIIVTMIVPVAQRFSQRTEKIKCMNNLRNLYAGANFYVQDKSQWPQISTTLAQKDPPAYATAWMNALRPYGIPDILWYCPTTTRDSGGVNSQKEIHIDYLPTPFDSKPNTPYKWPHQPWFVERGAVHEGGNLIIFTNGSILTLTEAYLAHFN